jgi:predicted HAD superfamily Cof-like phosphohydrolase
MTSGIEAFYAGQSYYDMVRNFHISFEHPVGDEEKPRALSMSRRVARMEWLAEEMMEFVSSEHLVNQVDAILDTLYFILGCHVEMGSPIDVSFLYVGARGEHYPECPTPMPGPGRLEACKEFLQKVFTYGHLKSKGDQYTCLASMSESVMDTLAKLGCHPKGLFEIVHDSNMGKKWPDGTVKYDPISGKILKSPSWTPPEPDLKIEIRKRVKNYFAERKAKEKEDDIPF